MQQSAKHQHWCLSSLPRRTDLPAGQSSQRGCLSAELTVRSALRAAALCTLASSSCSGAHSLSKTTAVILKLLVVTNLSCAASSRTMASSSCSGVHSRSAAGAWCVSSNGGRAACKLQTDTSHSGCSIAQSTACHQTMETLQD